MASRRFVLAPAAEVAPWMVHPTSGWVVAQLLANLEAGVGWQGDAPLA
jgi:7,8-dihydro-6-hydroxymethylpterin-pyrophosphokinase